MATSRNLRAVQQQAIRRRTALPLSGAISVVDSGASSAGNLDSGLRNVSTGDGRAAGMEADFGVGGACDMFFGSRWRWDTVSGCHRLGGRFSREEFRL